MVKPQNIERNTLILLVQGRRAPRGLHQVQGVASPALIPTALVKQSLHGLTNKPWVISVMGLFSCWSLPGMSPFLSPK